MNGIEQLEIRWKRCWGEARENGMISEAIKEIRARRMDGREPVSSAIGRRYCCQSTEGTCDHYYSAKEAARGSHRLFPKWLAASGHACEKGVIKQWILPAATTLRKQ